MARLRLILVLPALFLAAGCGADEDDPAPQQPALDAQAGCDSVQARLAAEPAVAAPGETVGVAVENLTGDRVITYGLGSALERAEAGEWREVDLPRRAVIQIALVVRPGETGGGGSGDSRDVVELPGDLEPGRYRLMKEVTASPAAGGAPEETEALRLCAPLEIEA